MGENAIYIRKAMGNRVQPLDLNPFTPTVFIFYDQAEGYLHSIYDSNITKRTLDLKRYLFTPDNLEAPDFIYSVFFTITKTEYLCDGNIMKADISALLFLYTQLWMGLDRYNKLVSRPKKIPMPHDA